MTHISVDSLHTCSAADEHDLFSPSICRWRERDGGRASTVEATTRPALTAQRHDRQQGFHQALHSSLSRCFNLPDFRIPGPIPAPGSFLGDPKHSRPPLSASGHVSAPGLCVEVPVLLLAIQEKRPRPTREAATQAAGFPNNGASLCTPRPNRWQPNRRRGAFIHYADLAAHMVMLDIEARRGRHGRGE